MFHPSTALIEKKFVRRSSLTVCCFKLRGSAGCCVRIITLGTSNWITTPSLSHVKPVQGPVPQPGEEDCENQHQHTPRLGGRELCPSGTAQQQLSVLLIGSGWKLPWTNFLKFLYSLTQALDKHEDFVLLSATVIKVSKCCLSCKIQNQCCGSMTFWCGSGSGSADPSLWLMDQDPRIHPSDKWIQIRIGIRIRILLFSLLSFKMPTKN